MKKLKTMRSLETPNTSTSSTCLARRAHGVIVLASSLRERSLPLTKELDEAVAKLHLPAPGAALTVLTQEQAGRTGVKI